MPLKKKRLIKPAAFNPIRTARQHEDAVVAALAAKQRQKHQNQHQQVKQLQTTSQTSLCQNPSCPGPSIVDGVCQTCGRVVDESNIVAEVQFGESSTGAAVVQGQFVGEDQGGITSIHPALRRIGGSADTRDRSIRDARHEMEKMAQHLRIPERIVQRAVQVFKLALVNRFTQGRRLPAVYASCLYLACRSHKDGGEDDDGCDRRDFFDDVVNRKPAEDQVMLIDFADLIRVNVFRLGRTFKRLHEVVPVTENGWLPISPEDLIYRFASRLEFLYETDDVALTAVRLAKRMSLDMIAEGRRPSGICGACLLMAARIHNFRRSVREVVYVVKVTMETIRMRMDEFRSTEASGLSIEDFLSENWTAVRRAKPPSYYQSEHAKIIRSRKQNREMIAKSGGDAHEIDLASQSNDETNVENTARKEQLIEQLSSLPFVEYHRDTKGRIILPTGCDEEHIDGTDRGLLNNLAEEFLDEDARNKTWETHDEQALPIDGIWRGEEEEIEQEITELINDPATVQHARAYEVAMQRAKVHQEIATRDLKEVSMDPTVAEDEFADDLEVQNCVLSEEEARIKEVLWTNENEQYLRKEQAKIFHEKITFKRSKASKRGKKHRGGQTEGPAATAAESAKSIANRLHFSSRIDYQLLDDMFAKAQTSELMSKTSSTSKHVS